MDSRECGSKTVSDVLDALDDTRDGVDISPEQGVGKKKADAGLAPDTPSWDMWSRRTCTTLYDEPISNR